MADFAITEPITLAEAKTYLRVDDSTEDDLISILISAARQYAERHENRLLVARTAEDVAETDYYTPDELEKAAMFLFLGHLYENREAVVIGATAVEMPLGARWLLDKYRVYPI